MHGTVELPVPVIPVPDGRCPARPSGIVPLLMGESPKINDPIERLMQAYDRRMRVNVIALE